MKIKSIFFLFIVTILMLFSFSTGTLAEVTSTGESEASITFTPNTDPTDPVDPEDPSQPLDPEDPSGPGTGKEGPLSLDYVSSIEFGEDKVLFESKTYQSTTLKPFIQVTDKRGTGAGWKVTAQVSCFQDTGIDTLPGAKITFNNGKVISPFNANPPIPNSSVELETGGDAVTVVTATTGATAEEKTGMGTWVNRWFPSASSTEGRNDNVLIKVPELAASAGNHTATITWTLTDAPN